MAGADRKRRRCAAYTRKSSEEGLEQDFNSLDAQREACEAYIRSQAGEGWRPLRARYDDGGFSGGNLERPALQRLLADIAAGKVETVVVYKVDRLTRSLADFAKIVEILDAHGVSFVSVTQQFNTTTSMGRLTLNMLLSFAQFEREVTGERIRDKIAASKRKGLWMGGYVPLGYEADGRTLVVHEAEAETVRTVFRLYLELGSVRRVQEEAQRLGLCTKVRKGKSQRMRGGNPLTRGHIYHLLRNPLYIGRIAHRGESYAGQHAPVIDLPTWDAVQTRLDEQAPVRPVGCRVTEPSPLRGRVFDESGARLTPSHTAKSGRRYRYYVSREQRAGSAGADAEVKSPRWRLPARDLERIVETGVKTLLADPSALASQIRDTGFQADKVPALLAGAKRWRGAPLELVKRVDLSKHEVSIQVDLSGITGETGPVVKHVVSARLRRRGIESRLVLEGDGGRPEPDWNLVHAMVRAHRWHRELTSGRARSFAQIAKDEGVDESYVSYLFPLAFLAPDIVTAILDGKQPVHVTTELLTKRIDLPLDWREQRTQLGFPQP